MNINSPLIKEISDNNPIREVVEDYGISLTQQGSTYLGLCPFHDDHKTPNLTIYTSTNSFYCFRCGAGGDVFEFVKLIENISFISARNKLAQRCGLTCNEQSESESAEYEEERRRVKEYIKSCSCNLSETVKDILRKRGLTNETIDKYQIGFDEKKKRIIIPLTQYGQPVSWVERAISDNQSPKYLFPKAKNKPLVGKEYLAKEGCVIVEGIFDWLSIIQAGLPAACILGTKPSPEQLEGLSFAKSPVILFDGDTAGREAAIKLSKDLFPLCKIAFLADGDDPNSLAVEDPINFKALIEEVIGKAKNPLDIAIEDMQVIEDTTQVDVIRTSILPLIAKLNDNINEDLYIRKLAKKAKMTQKLLKNELAKIMDSNLADEKDAEKEAEVDSRTLEKGRAFADIIGTDPLTKMVEIVNELGVVGEESNIKLIYLALTSRILKKPVSLVVKGISSGGKSFVVEKVLNLFPESAYWRRTALSPKALAYSNESFTNRTLVIFEADGLSEDGDYLLRSLLSEGCILYETVESSPSGLAPKLIKKDGPTNCILTTTKTRLHKENETRLLSLSVNDSRQQTKAVLERIAVPVSSNIDLSDWHAFQKWLQAQQNDVVIPYAKSIARLISPSAVRLKRDFSHVMSLIRSHALICRNYRETNEAGLVIASIEDYMAVRELIEPIVSEGIELSVKNIVREAVEAVDCITAQLDNPVQAWDEKTASVTEVARYLKIETSSASRRLREAKDKGYVINQETRRGFHARYMVHNSMPEAEEVFPSVEKLITDSEFVSP